MRLDESRVPLYRTFGGVIGGEDRTWSKWPLLRPLWLKLDASNGPNRLFGGEIGEFKGEDQQSAEYGDLLLNSTIFQTKSAIWRVGSGLDEVF